MTHKVSLKQSYFRNKDLKQPHLKKKKKKSHPPYFRMILRWAVPVHKNPSPIRHSLRRVNSERGIIRKIEPNDLL